MPESADTPDFFRPRLVEMIDLRHPLAVLANTSPLAIDDPALAAGQLHALAERAARCGLRVGFEALTWGRHTARCGQAWDIVRRAKWQPDSFQRRRVSTAQAPFEQSPIYRSSSALALPCLTRRVR